MLKLISPLTPATGAGLALVFADLMRIDPLDEAALEPLVRSNLPPVVPKSELVAPAVIAMSAPTPLLPAPAEIDI